MDNGAQVHQEDSSRLLEEIAAFIEKLNTISEEEVLSELSGCDTDVLMWLLNDIAIPNLQYDVADVILRIIHSRSTP
ncbi:MAG: hypothetical protein JNL13_11985 [Chitinophagaceae bacterium]|nr:hypothetical protein [Chitinophagaceae bacterium]